MYWLGAERIYYNKEKGDKNMILIDTRDENDIQLGIGGDVKGCAAEAIAALRTLYDKIAIDKGEDTANAFRLYLLQSVTIAFCNNKSESDVDSDLKKIDERLQRIQRMMDALRGMNHATGNEEFENWLHSFEEGAFEEEEEDDDE